MLQKIIVKCSFSGDQKVNYNWGLIMHGVLMEHLSESTAEALHGNNPNSFSQFVIPMGDNSLEWHIGIWDDVLADEIIKAITPLVNININHKDIVLDVLSVNRYAQNERDFLVSFFNDNKPCRNFKIEFVTPGSHRSGGEYVLFPSVKLILQNLLMRFDTVSSEFSIEDEETLLQLIDDTEIVRYSLRSASYNVKGFSVASYMGWIIINVKGSDQLARLVALLISFAEYAGIGIKTSLGMGGCRITKMDYMNRK